MSVLIVGGGLSGICLGHTLEQQNIDFKIIDCNQNHSSKVAAGMINPMTFRRMIKSWKADELIPFLNQFYAQVEEKIEEKFLFPIRLRRAFASEHERALWIERLNNPQYANFVNPIERSETTPNYLKDNFGNAFISTPGYIDAKTFMEANHRYFIQKDCLQYDNFDYSALDVENKTYDSKAYTQLVFAEGFQGEDNPFFGYLPFKNAKGEVLTINSSDFREDEILNRKCFVLPTKNGDFKLGSTYAWDTKSTEPTQGAREALLERYEGLSTAIIEVVGHEAGIRPTAADRRPMLGEHPQYKDLFIFNGLGAKGYMLAPYFADAFVKYLMGKAPLDKEVDIQRFYKKHFKK
ncbi:NAD(P)/FAD-dependent oxidoreductase [Brumimicrobium salinarum]|uniref:NAD(P)/FAD-dependent oxidoreductase n=1 Tax=Brumimicrobium salinarum TaxID=2058658 RepID=UPI0013FE0F06|nr:FAD-dependent oxidoreductase [Brumimicrobium salinarum]